MLCVHPMCSALPLALFREARKQKNPVLLSFIIQNLSVIPLNAPFDPAHLEGSFACYLPLGPDFAFQCC